MTTTTKLFVLFLTVVFFMACCTAAGVTAGGAGALVAEQVINNWVASGKIASADGQVLIQALHDASSGRWETAVGTALVPTIGLIASHMHGSAKTKKLKQALVAATTPPSTPQVSQA